MSKIKIGLSIIEEYGIAWVILRFLYSLKLKVLTIAPFTSVLFEKKAPYPSKLDLFQLNVSALRSKIQALDSTSKSSLIEHANNACDGVIRAFSSIDLDYGFPIDWQLQPLTGFRCDENKQWFKIPDFDNTRGDIKVVWEASRFLHFILFARAFLLTGDTKYYKAFSEQLSSWLHDNPYEYGANFKCGQECSIRMVNALLAYTVFKECNVTTDEDASNIRDLIDRCYRKVLSNFFYAYRCIKNNHTISALMGMIVGAWCCNDSRRLNKAYIILDAVVQEQFTKDGGYCQFSFNYQRVALQDLNCILSISKETGCTLSEKSIEYITNAALLMYQCQDEQGDMPNYGSNDGSLFFQVSSCNYCDFRPVINTTYALCTGFQLYEDGQYQEELLWFSGGKTLDAFERKYLSRVSSQFIEAGLFTIRSEHSWAMIVSNNYHTRPAHMDQGHLDLWIDGVNVLCDAGTYSYNSDLGRALVRNENHNTVFVNGRPQMSSFGPFLIYGWTRRVLGNCTNTRFEGRINSANGYKHDRTVTLSGNVYQINDIVDKDYFVTFHTACGAVVEDNKVVLIYKGRRICEISGTSSIDVAASYRSLFYFKKEKTTSIIMKCNAGMINSTNIKVC